MFYPYQTYTGYAKDYPQNKVEVRAFSPRGAALKAHSLLKHMRLIPADMDKKQIKVEVG